MDAREQMIAEIEEETGETSRLTGRTRLSTRVRAALAKVRREAFVPEAEAPYAYVNAPLPIGHRQTISQPFIVALMTELLDLQPDDVVLEIGTGSGYQAAILAELARRVYTIELIPELAAAARAALQREGYGTIELRCGDGALGWPEHAPFGKGPIATKVRRSKITSYSITSSARPSSIGGTSMPIAFAVLRLMINKNLVGKATGRSAGLAPLSILST